MSGVQPKRGCGQEGNIFVKYCNKEALKLFLPSATKKHKHCRCQKLFCKFSSMFEQAVKEMCEWHVLYGFMWDIYIHVEGNNTLTAGLTTPSPNVHFYFKMCDDGVWILYFYAVMMA